MTWLKKKNAFRWDWKILSRLLTIIIIITNNSLKFAVMTGCMRISKESIFTGLNNLKVLSITDERYDDVIFCERKEWIGIEERSSA